MKSVVIVQPCFFPWRGQFDLFCKGDIVVLLDDVQYVRRSWYNRNKIFSENNPKWITVPVHAKGQYHAKIKDVRIHNEQNWKMKIYGQLRSSYSKYEYFSYYFREIQTLLSKDWEWLADLDQATLEWTFKKLNKKINFIRSSEMGIVTQDPVSRLISICKKVGAEKYISGPSAKRYIKNKDLFTEEGIILEWMDYPHYRAYPRPFGDMKEELSILDLFFCVGNDAAEYIWGF